MYLQYYVSEIVDDPKDNNIQNLVDFSKNNQWSDIKVNKSYDSAKSIN